MSSPGLYIHIPFCRGKCPYCSFYSIVDPGDPSPLIEAILAEISLYGREFDRFDTVYIGGGTPSVLPVQQFERILNGIGQGRLLKEGAEITVEVNPSDVNASYLSSLRRCGVNRLNIGVQSFDDGLLRFLGRRHSGRQAFRAIDASLAAGFDNVGLDLLYGVPGQSLASWEETLSRALSRRPQHLSCYQLSLAADTPLGRQCGRGRFHLPDGDAQADFFLGTSEFLEGAGYLHYEVSNFAGSDSLVSRHNRKYWRHVPYLGVGPSAHSFLRGRRWWNHRSVRRYIDDLAARRPPVAGAEDLSPEQLKLEALFLGLRTREGIDLTPAAEPGRPLAACQKRDPLLDFVTAGLIERKGNRVRPTRAGLAVADALALNWETS